MVRNEHNVPRSTDGLTYAKFQQAVRLAMIVLNEHRGFGSIEDTVIQTVLHQFFDYGVSVDDAASRILGIILHPVLPSLPMAEHTEKETA